MAKGSKRRNEEDDFILTISDNEDGIEETFEEETAPEPPASKKRKREAVSDSKKNGSKSKKVKNVGAEGEENEDIWGKRDEDDGAMDSDFEFGMEAGADEDLGDFDGWGFDGAKKSMDIDKKGVDIDEIIERRRAKNKGSKNELEAEHDLQPEAEDEEPDLTADLDDEYMAEDGFGMAVASDEEEESDGNAAGDQSGESADEGEDSDDDSVASEVAHPDDEDSEGSGDEGEDEEEAAKRAAFFAPEEKFSKAKKDETLSFQTMSLSRPIHRGLAAVGFAQPTPIQAKTIPVALMGKDIVGGAVTGSGKTAAFIVPILERLLYRPKKVPTSRVVILVPTRELAIQCHAVATKLASFTDIKFCLAVGGLSLKMQEAELRLRPDVIIATPGRFIDHMRNSASFTVDTLEILVLDEADRMLEDGFADELDEILKTIPKSRQTMLFSATMTSSVDKLIRVGLNKPVRLMVDAQKQTALTLTQEFVRLRPGREDKRLAYLMYLCKNVFKERTIIFFRQKKEVHRVRIIFGLCNLKAAELHGSMTQEQRIASVEGFRDGKVSYLLATDLASRGLDIKGVDTVINYEAPQSLEIYVHRVGRTARAGRAGHACTLAAEPDRKVVKQAVKAGKAQGAKIASRVVDPGLADSWHKKIEELDKEVKEILREEQEEKQFAQAEMQIRKTENIVTHEREIMGRPKRTWFETEREKLLAKKRGQEELNGGSGSKAKKGKLSNKDKKKLDDREQRSEGKTWKKGKAERDGKGAVQNFKKGPKKAKGGAKPGPKKAFKKR